MADLSGVLAKLDRAEEHRQAFDDLFEEFHAGNPYSILSEYDPETGWHSLRWNVLQDLPLQRLGLLFGDMISNLRTTLDYLVWQLVLAGGSRPGRRTGFPVVRKEKDWEVQSRTALRGVPPEWAAEIEARQPFQVDQPAFHPLAILDHVNNVNKHRFLPVAVLSVEQLGLLINVEPVPGEKLETRDFLDRPITQGGELARFRVESRVPLEVVVNQAPQIRLAFDDGLNYDWYPFELIEWVSETVAHFAVVFQDT